MRNEGSWNSTQCVYALCRCRQITRARDVFADMVDAGCNPHSITFGNLMMVHVKYGRTENVLQIDNQIELLSIVADTIITFL